MTKPINIYEVYARKLELEIKEKDEEIKRLNKKIDDMVANGIMLYFQRPK